MPESIFDRKSRVRPPRVHITYEVETGDAMQLKELPFVLGVMADLSGQPEEPLGRLADRKFVSIDRDNFNDVLQSIRPRVAMRVQNRLTDEDSDLSVELRFEKLADFDPAQIAQQIEPLRRLLEMRGQLKDLLSRMEGNERLERMLAEVIDNAQVRSNLEKGLGASREDAPVEEGN